LLDAVYGRLCFPTCYYANRLPNHIALLMEAAYRAQLVRRCPPATDDARFSREIVHACAYWLISNGNWMLASAYQDDRQWGISTWRQRVLLRLELIANTTTEFNYFGAMGETARICLARLREIWPPDVHNMPYYPAFRGGSKDTVSGKA
jgi:hypothetical protein